jgi:hypothetical protein
MHIDDAENAHHAGDTDGGGKLRGKLPCRAGAVCAECQVRQIVTIPFVSDTDPIFAGPVSLGQHFGFNTGKAVERRRKSGAPMSFS